MKIALYYPRSIYAAWSLSEGLTRTLRSLGHEVIETATPTAPTGREVSAQLVDELKTRFPKLSDLKGQDLILVSGPEHINPWMELVYGLETWKSLAPKAGWYHESMDRNDGGHFAFDSILDMCDYHFFPAAQDADYLSQEQFAGDRAYWLPFGADTEIFHPCLFKDIPRHNSCNATTGYQCLSCKTEKVKKYDIAFIGSVYGYRANWCDALAQFNHPAIRCGNVELRNLDGVNHYETAKLYAADLRRIRVFLNMPSLSRLHVTKVVEAMACGTFTMTMAMGGPAAQNMKQFEDKVHLAYYKPAELAQTGRAMQHWLDHKDEREQIAKAGCEYVHKNFSLKQQCRTLLEKCGVSIAAAA